MSSKPKKTLLSYFTSKNAAPFIPSTSSTAHDPILNSSIDQEQPPSKVPRFEDCLEVPSVGVHASLDVSFDVPTDDLVDVPSVDHTVPRIDSSLIRDPGLRLQIWQHPVNSHDEVRRKYIQMGPYQPSLLEYLGTIDGNQVCRFVAKWYHVHHWLEYSPAKNKAYCFPCFLFETKKPSRLAFTVDGFSSWKRIGGNSCPLVKHVGETNSKHICVERALKDLGNSVQHIGRALNLQRSEIVVKNRLCLMTSLKTVLLLALQNCPFRGHDESIACGNILSQYGLEIDDLRGQGYDGASNMGGAWNGLQALLKDECPYAYYVHCFAHQLQLALCAASREVHEVWQFFLTMNTIVNIVGASPKRHTELTNAQRTSFAEKVARGEVGGGRGSNQIQTLHRAGATRWSSHFDSIRSLIHLFDESAEILFNIWKSPCKSARNNQRQEAKGCYVVMRSFDFVFMLHLLHKMFETTYMLCQAMQRKNQDIVNAMSFVSSTKVLLQRLRDNGWQTFFETVESFCTKNGIVMPVMDAQYMLGTGRSCQQHDTITIGHHYRVDVFNATIDSQLMELNNRFSECATELLTLGAALDPRDSFKSFDIDQISDLVSKFYSVDFKVDGHLLRTQLHHFQVGVVENPNFQNLYTVEDLCVKLASTGLGKHYFLVDRLIRLLLTLPVSTATTERAFSAMKLVKTRLRNKMDEEFLEDCMILNIERDLSLAVDLDSVIVEFYTIKDRRVQLM